MPDERASAADLRVESFDDPAPGDLAAVDDGLDAYNRKTADLDGVRRMGCFARLPGGAVVGGAVGRTWGAACELQQLWVHEAHRRRGLGARLVRAFEDAARRRGCDLLYLDTFTWQAPAFYARLGFRVACEFAGFPGGARKLILRKALGREASAGPAP
jgi:ribosomal protein S18 acetylase RimI-like enzyme